MKSSTCCIFENVLEINQLQEPLVPAQFLGIKGPDIHGLTSVTKYSSSTLSSSPPVVRGVHLNALVMKVL